MPFEFVLIDAARITDPSSIFVGVPHNAAEGSAASSAASGALFSATTQASRTLAINENTLDDDFDNGGGVGPGNTLTEPNTFGATTYPAGSRVEVEYSAVLQSTSHPELYFIASYITINDTFVGVSITSAYDANTDKITSDSIYKHGDTHELLAGSDFPTGSTFNTFIQNENFNQGPDSSFDNDLEWTASSPGVIDPVSLRDTDGDGVFDLDDLDDDNDGILDTDEGVLDISTLTASGVTGPLHQVSGGGFSVDIETVDQNGNGAQASDQEDKHILRAIEFNGVRYEDFILPDSYTSGFDADDGVRSVDNGGFGPFSNTDATWEQDILANAFQNADLGEYQTVDTGVEASDFYTLGYETPIISSGAGFIAVTERNSNNDQVIEALDADGNVLGTPIVVDASAGDYFDTGHDVHFNDGQNAGIAVYALDNLVPLGTEIHGLRISFNAAVGDGPDGKVFIFGDEEQLFETRDTDGDGVADHLDLDSDSDGISDLVETGQDASVGDTNMDGVHDGAVTGDGVPVAAGAGLLPIDSDLDGISDHLDLDADNDGLSDFIEAQATGSYTGTDGDVSDQDSDGDGVIDLFDSNDSTTGAFGGTFVNPVNTDGTDNPDYLDTNSDNDAFSDTVESGVTNTGGDANSDGIQDGVGVTYTDPSGGVDDLLADLTNADTDPLETDFRSVPCFTPETLIATVRGEVRAGDLSEGDLVLTRDNGFQPVQWVGRTRVALGAANAKLRPVQIRAGALGHGLPERDMLVSPQHRMLVTSDLAEVMFQEREVLVPAKHLTGLDGVDQVTTDTVSYLHLMFDQHEVVLADGAWSESFQPGDQSLRGVGADQRAEILSLFPELETLAGHDAYPAARPSLKRYEAELLISRLK